MAKEMILEFRNMSGEAMSFRVTHQSGVEQRRLIAETGVAYRLNEGSGNVWNVGNWQEYKTPIHVGKLGRLIE